MGWPVVTPSCAEQVVKSEAATKIQKAMRSFVWRRVFRGMVQQVQAAAQAKEEAAAKAVLKDKALSDQALFAKRSERKRSERNALALALRKLHQRAGWRDGPRPFAADRGHAPREPRVVRVVLVGVLRSAADHFAVHRRVRHGRLLDQGGL